MRIVISQVELRESLPDPRPEHRTTKPGIPATSDPRNHAGLRLATWIKEAHTGFEPVPPP
jgi:hypothetical protein